MTTAADFRDAINVSVAFAYGQEPDKAPIRALYFLAYLAGTLVADEPGLHQLLVAMLPANPAALAA